MIRVLLRITKTTQSLVGEACKLIHERLLQSLETFMKGKRFRSKVQKQYDTDPVIKKLWQRLLQDFRASSGSEYGLRYECEFKRGIPIFRDYKFPSRMDVSPYVFKQDAQLEGLMKRYRFKNDRYTDEELKKLTREKFWDHQVSMVEFVPQHAALRPIISEARRILRKMLGPYDAEEHMAKCRFGKRAAKGVPARNAYLDSKLLHLSGSPEHIEWFCNDYLPTDNILWDCIRRSRGLAFDDYAQCLCTVCDVLDYTDVPKSWKIFRGIVPNSVIGSFYSYGLGALFQERLKVEGLDIKRLQQKHRRWVKSMSRTRKWVTADLSNASNSFTCALVNALLPRDWFRACNFGRIRKIAMDGVESYTASFMMMGIGFTFTLQTALFYALLKAVQNLTGITGKISVYGDDLIYPTGMHVYVAWMFEKLGFTFNRDKTYVTSHFRESCGADYYRGVDVRPFSPEGQHQMLSKAPYVCFIYKLINGLLQRWTDCEIPSTIAYLYSEVIRVDNRLFQVPPIYPDYSGVKVDRIQSSLDGLPWAPAIWDCDIQSFKFLCYGLEPDSRVVVHEHAYYWEALRGNAQGVEDLSIYSSAPEAILKTVVCKDQPRNYRSKLTGKRLIKTVSVVARKGVGNLHRKRCGESGRRKDIRGTGTLSCWVIGRKTRRA